MKREEIMKQGEQLHQEYLEALRKASTEQMAEANREVQEHLSEYGHSFANAITGATE